MVQRRSKQLPHLRLSDQGNQQLLPMEMLDLQKCKERISRRILLSSVRVSLPFLPHFLSSLDFVSSSFVMYG